MNDNGFKKCKKRECNNIVLKGKYCERCKRIRSEQIKEFMKDIGCIAGSIGSIALAVVLKRKPK